MCCKKISGRRRWTLSARFLAAGNREASSQTIVSNSLRLRATTAADRRLGNTLIDCAIETVAAGLSGEAACKSAWENALKEHTRNGFRSVEEHYQREAHESVGQVRDRLDAARTRCDFGALASDLLSPENTPSTARLPKHSDVDEGPPL